MYGGRHMFLLRKRASAAAAAIPTHANYYKRINWRNKNSREQSIVSFHELIGMFLSHAWRPLFALAQSIRPVVSHTNTIPVSRFLFTIRFHCSLCDLSRFDANDGPLTCACDAYTEPLIARRFYSIRPIVAIKENKNVYNCNLCCERTRYDLLRL